MQTIHGFSPFRQTLILSFRARSASTNSLNSSNTSSSSTSSSSPRRVLRQDSTKKPQTLPVKPNLKRLTFRIVQLTRRRQLRQIFEEVEVAKQQYGKLNTIVMNAVMEACVHCGEVDSALQIYQELLKPDSCGVDNVTLGILLKGLGEARRIDEAFQLLESIEQGKAAGNQKLSPGVIYGLLNALIEAGDLRRANGLLASYRSVLHEGGPSIQMYNLLMKGYINAGFPEDALTLHDEILRHGLKPDRLTYNTMLFACVKAGKMNAAMGLFSEMKDEAQNITCPDLFPDAITFTTLLKGFGHAKDLHSVQTIVMEMKSLHELFIDRIAYTAMVDALLICGSTKGALCIFGEIQKLAGGHPNLRPKPHLYLSMMRAFAVQGDFIMVKSLHSRMWPDTSGVISSAVQVEAEELLMEAALNNGQVDVARQILSNIITKWEGVPWTSRGSLVAVKVEALSGFTKSTFSPSLLPKVSLDDPIENIMTSFEETRPLRANLDVKDVLMHFFRNSVVPIIDEWGSCVGMVHREDCTELNAPLSKIMQSPPPYVTTSTSIGPVINLILEKKYKMIIVIKPRSLFETGYNSSLRPVGVFTSEQLSKIAVPASEGQESCICRIST